MSGAASPSGPSGPPPPHVHAEISADDTRRMAPIYIAVLVVEVIVLLAIWGFQEYFG